jgi:hypothetical protein
LRRPAAARRSTPTLYRVRFLANVSRRDCVWLGLIAIAISLWWALHLPVTWTEDVELADSTVAKVRVTVYGNHTYGEIGGPGGSRADAYGLSGLEVLRIDKPWRGETGAAIIFNKTTTGEWYIVSAAISREDVWKWADKSRPYTEFRFRNGEWIRVPLGPERISESANLMLIDTGQRGHYTLSKKRSIRATQHPSDEYARIVDKWKSNC